MSDQSLQRLYSFRFSKAEQVAKDAIWEVLCSRYFQSFVRESDTVLDIACGYGEFIRHIRASRKFAIDLNPAVAAQLPDGVTFVNGSADRMPEFPTGSIDVCFTSNFFEHLPNHAAMDAVLTEARRVLRPGGKFICMQPNIRYAGNKYWDFYDHVLPLSHLSTAEAFAQNGFELELVLPRFVPFSTKSRFPKHPLFVKAYLRCPWLWRVLGAQFVVVARTPKQHAG